MDKASDFGSEDCRFESCQGRGHLCQHFAKPPRIEVRSTSSVAECATWHMLRCNSVGAKKSLPFLGFQHGGVGKAHLAREGLEPSTFALLARRSNRLSYPATGASTGCVNFAANKPTDSYYRLHGLLSSILYSTFLSYKLMHCVE